MADQSQSGIRLAPGIASITRVNWPGLRALYVKEVRRFFKVQLQTVWAPAAAGSATLDEQPAPNRPG